MLSLFGTNSIVELLGTASFWFTIAIIVGLIALFVVCIKHWHAGGKYGLLSIFILIFAGFTIYAGINLNAYYSARGGIYGALTGIFETNEVEIVDNIEYKISNTELIQVGNSDTYSANIILDEVFELGKDIDYMVYVNNMPCTYVENARDYVLADYKYTFYDEDFNVILTDTLNFRFAFYTNSTSLKISTNGGSEALKYWHHYFNKNTFIVKLAEVESLKDFDVSIGNGDISNYCIVSYSIDDEITSVQVYQKGQTLNLIKINNENYNYWSLDGVKVDSDFIITEDIVLIAEYEVVKDGTFNAYIYVLNNSNVWSLVYAFEFSVEDNKVVEVKELSDIEPFFSKGVKILNDSYISFRYEYATAKSDIYMQYDEVTSCWYATSSSGILMGADIQVVRVN